MFVRELANRLPLTHELHNQIFEALRANRIEIPFPQRDMHLRNVPAETREARTFEPPVQLGAQSGFQKERINSKPGRRLVGYLLCPSPLFGWER